MSAHVTLLLIVCADLILEHPPAEAIYGDSVRCDPDWCTCDSLHALAGLQQLLLLFLLGVIFLLHGKPDHRSRGRLEIDRVDTPIRGCCQSLVDTYRDW